MRILTLEEAGKQLAQMIRRSKPFDISYMRKLIAKEKITPINPSPPWMIDLEELKRFSQKYEKALKSDKRTTRHFK